ncbi:Clan SC, family S9, unassigned serine peptidase [Tritrichomonas foetus]|uniref:Clan SC, family S9, unassigned serine peptidase n=1 Tax=Tritrichomonas foetus TaxID=1144522 RepID=A0A1J4K9Y9_9EUKA|nr:Clan SC, family S9, unassigned serine peptidase [Tritrichomonas foetus]|eukprot:OHT08043.1 Clan SC, family S9, unassigned serine peptidase [Tritrichomonas foetus]
MQITEGIRAICRPPRAIYPIEQLPTTVPVPNYGDVTRHPVEFKNCRGETIIGSYYPPNEEIENQPCVIYLHGNASCQLEGVFLIPVFVPIGVSVLCIDTSGSGLSGGDYISLGLFERDDVLAAISHIREKFNVGKVALWGRSMGASTVFISLGSDPTISGAVADSPFSSLEQIIRELAGMFMVPGCLLTPAVWFVKNKIKKIANFDIYDVEPIKYAKESDAPIYIIHGAHDDFIDKEHSKRLYQAYRGEDKKIVICRGHHDTERPMKVQIDAIKFIAGLFDITITENDIPELIKSADHHFSSVSEMLTDVE